MASIQKLTIDLMTEQNTNKKPIKTLLA